jgi:hypothetical protein
VAAPKFAKIRIADMKSKNLRNLFTGTAPVEIKPFATVSELKELPSEY